jgi:hypothetical protein
LARSKDRARHGRQSALWAHTRARDEYCLSCHYKDHEKGQLILETIAEDDIAEQCGCLGKVVRKLRARLMPPVGKERPDDPNLRQPSFIPRELARSRGGWPIQIRAYFDDSAA